MYLQIKNMHCGYNNDFSIRNINFGIERGVFAGIIGPNGSGKTTLFKGISGDLPLRSGTVYLDNQNVAEMTLREKAQRIAVVSQHTEILDITVEDYVMMGRMPYRQQFQFFESKNDFDIAEEYMKLTNVLHLRTKLMSQLSGGEQQLAAIARALTQQPHLLLLDEPTSHLDITHQVQILNLIQKLNARLNLTVLIIIHDLNLAGEYCDYLMMMKDGNIHLQGKPAEVLHYKSIEDVYDTVVITRENPVSKKPVVFLVSDRVLENKQ